MRVLIVEDDPVYAKYLKHNIELNPDYEAVVYKTGMELLNNLTANDQVISLDYSLPDMSCELLIKKIREINQTIHIVTISAQEEISTAVKLLRAGVYDYIEKNEETRNRLLNTIKHIQENQLLKSELEILREEVQTKYDFSSILKGNSQPMERVFQLMEKASKANITVSISGETGTGKELVAKAVHYNSNLRNKPLISVNMSAIPKDLIESELFGHEKGAFTGASARRIGKFEEANGGTLFLDEIAELDLNLQSKILRALQEKEIERIGGNNKIKLNFRLLVATHRDLAEEVKNGNFREDLFYRVLGLPIKLPPLRERGKDILVLATHFMDEFCKENKLKKKSISTVARQKLMEYSWPGNVREIKAVVELAIVMSNEDEILADDITLTSTRNTPDFLLKEMTMKDYVNSIMVHFLEKYDNNVMTVAAKLNIGKSTIYRMLKETVRNN
ncbi:MAG: regulator [Crocinitomicaceae bacterium]|nr:regulator [Crocinitomicaceae bacterium]|tara:strand:+ start:625 stop:1965 length:1341 start_codon:yes stop_codon:yes gene_type:complete